MLGDLLLRLLLAVLPRSLLEPVRTLTATIAAEMGETVHGDTHYRALFLIGAVLFAITLGVNGVATAFLRRAQLRAGGRP